MKEILSNPIVLLLAGLFIFFLPRLFRLLMVASLLSVGVVGLFAKSDRLMASE